MAHRFFLFLKLMSAAVGAATVSVPLPVQGYEMNVGQYPNEVLFGKSSSDGIDNLHLFRNGAQVPGGLLLQFGGANPNSRVSFLGLLPYPLNVYVGPPGFWRENVPHFTTIFYSQIYPGIDLQWNLEQLRVCVAPGADLRKFVVQTNQEVLVSDSEVFIAQL